MRKGRSSRLHILQPSIKLKAMLLLCADDEEDIRTILEMSLALDPGIEAEIVNGGQALLNRATERNWDAYVVDGSMPDVDGLEVCRQLKANPATASTPVIFLTGRSQKNQVEQAQAAGAAATIAKPFDPLSLAGEIRRIVGK